MNYIAFLFTAASIVGTLANSFQKKWCFYIWLCTNSFCCIYNTINAQYAQALLYVFNLATCIIGLYKWRKPKQRDKIRPCNDCRYKLLSEAGVFNAEEPRRTIPPLRRCKHCGKTGVYYGEAFGGASMRIDAIVKHHNADGEEVFLCQKCHLKAHEIKPHAADGFRADVAMIDEPQEAEKPSEEIEDPYTRMSKALADLSTALIDAVRPTFEALTDVFFKFAKTYCNGDYEFLKWQYDNADPRLLHRAYNAKRYRTRKKNLARLHREYKKYIKKGGGRK